MAIQLLSCVIDHLDAKSARPVDVDANQRRRLAVEAFRDPMDEDGASLYNNRRLQ